MMIDLQSQKAPRVDGPRQADLRAGIARRAFQVLAVLLIQAALLFLSSGRLGWTWGWVFLGLYLAGILGNMVLMLRVSPETIAERGKAEGMKDWDKLVGGLWSLLYFLLVPIVAGLDERFGWTKQPGLPAHLAGAILFLLGFALFSWAMISNAYFSTIVRIQSDRGHTVCEQGPYRFLRHPGYLGAVAQNLSLPLLLGSFWALIPGGLAALLMVVRTALEDQTLQNELPGYREYARRVRYRLLPGIW